MNSDRDEILRRAEVLGVEFARRLEEMKALASEAKLALPPGCKSGM